MPKILPTVAGGQAVVGDMDLLDLADELAEIARVTNDPATGRRLMQLVNRLLTAAGLPPEAGGGETPDHWLSEPVCAPC
jgi:hypothetical protein